MRTEPAQKPITPPELYWLAAGITLSILPHAARIPAWIMLLSVTLILWRIANALGHWPLPDRKSRLLQVVQTLMIIAGFAGVYAHYHTLVGREAGTALLVLLTGFKILETQHEREFYLAAFLGFFIIITNFFSSQTIATAITMAFTVLVIMTALVTFNDRDQVLPVPARIKTAGNLLLQALPVMLVLFLLFPRINGPLWGLPDDAYSGRMGIDDEMAPGTISQLIQSDEVAFRVEFAGSRPPQEQLYWRGPVLWYNDGLKWTRERVAYRDPAQVEVSGAPVPYTITLEPTNERWLFALEMPDVPPDNGYFSYDFQLRTREPVNQRIRYDLNSHTDYKLGRADVLELRRALQLPTAFHPKAIALARSWRKVEPDPGAIIERALRMFNEEEFFYTLAPPLLPLDPVDEFLFNTRQGFCEHYAGAFVVLMRAAGIPARVVTGYQGGSYNPVGNYFVVSQRDAHAWAETWLPNRGWVRVDPTSAVAPARVLQGIEDALPEAIIDIPAVFNQSALSRDLWQNLRHTWDAVNNQWNQWVISYGPQRQTQFLQQFGLGGISLQWLSILLLVITGLLFLVIMFWLYQQYRPARDPARQLYDRFCRKLAAIGLRRLPHEGPMDYAARVAGRERNIADSVLDISALYVFVRYGSQRDKLNVLRDRINAFRPRSLLRKTAG